MIDSQEQRTWMSRVSFAVAGVGLLSCVLSSCQEEAQTRAGTAPAIEGEPSLVSKQVGVEPPVKVTPSPKTDQASEAVERDRTAETKTTSEASEPAEPEQASVDPATTLAVKRLIVTHAIKDREPLTTETLTVGAEPLMAFVEMSNSADVDQKIVVTFEGTDAKKVGFVTLNIPAGQKRWRTWAQTRYVRAPGQWTAIVASENGVELDRTAFEVEAEKEPVIEDTVDGPVSQRVTN